MRHFLICIHDGTPAYDAETRLMLRDLAPRAGRQLNIGVVPDWHGRWPIAAHPDYCRLLAESAGELLLHGYFHQRQRGRGPVSLLTEGSDEMNGLDADETSRLLERGQAAFTESFGHPAKGFLPPGWQPGHVRAGRAGRQPLQHLQHVLGFFALEDRAGRRIPLSTYTWDCGRWPWLGHLSHGLGRVSQFLERGVPALAIHPRDLHRGYWPQILLLVDELLAAGLEPITVARLLNAEAAA
jgi:hypothetical protein